MVDVALFSPEGVRFSGFRILAFTTFRASPVPAILVFTGRPDDIVTVYRYKIAPDGKSVSDCFKLGLDNVPTSSGTLIYMRMDKAEALDWKFVIRVDAVRLEDEIQNVRLLSNLMGMLRCRPSGPVCTSRCCIDQLKDMFAGLWRKNPKELTDADIFHRVKQIQRHLITLDALNPDDIRNGREGVLDVKTMAAIAKQVPGFEIDKTIIDRRITGYLATAARRVNPNEERSSAAETASSS
jgi:hypothetical protein